MPTARAAQHPTYPNPTIVEALLEVQYTLSPERPWNPDAHNQFFSSIRDEFPHFEPVPEITLQVLLSSALPSPAQPVQAPGARMRFLTAHRTRVVQLSGSAFSFSMLRPYTGWDQMRAGILKYWPQAREVVKPATVTRIGLRYINRIPRTTANQKAAYWLKASDFVPQAILDSERPFLARIEAQVGTHRRALVSVIDDTSKMPDQHGAIVFDIDCIHVEHIEAGKFDVAQVADQLHDQVWAIFAPTRSANLEKLLNKKNVRRK
jgi:uncharacterized protein (TIGR04255 family)